MVGKAIKQRMTMSAVDIIKLKLCNYKLMGHG